MKFGDILLSLLIILIFLMCCLVSYLSKGFKHIQNNWPEYRCNPVIMPFAGYFGHDTEENFSQCIGQMQSSVMGVFTADLHAGQHMLQNSIGNAASSMQSIRLAAGVGHHRAVRVFDTCLQDCSARRECCLLMRQGVVS